MLTGRFMRDTDLLTYCLSSLDNSDVLTEFFSAADNKEFQKFGSIDVGAQSTLGGQDIFARKYMYEK